MDNITTQNILNKYGFDAGPVDGVIGQHTKDATTRFQMTYNVRPLAIDGVPGPDTQAALQDLDASNGQLSAHFSYDELKCRHCGMTGVKRELLEALEKLRAITGPLNIVDAYRCADHNRQIGGAQNSQHIVGKAADVSVPIATVRQADAFTGIGTANGAIADHIDIRPGDPAHPLIFSDAGNH